MAYEGMFKVIEEGHELWEPWNRLGQVWAKMVGKTIEDNKSKEELKELEAKFIEEFGDLYAAVKRVQNRLPKEMRKAVAKRRDEKYAKHKKRKLPGLPKGKK